MNASQNLPLQDIDTLVDLINQNMSFTISTHKNSDGDGIGSATALYWALNQLKKTVRFSHVDNIPSRYNFLTQNIDSTLYSPEDSKSLSSFKAHDALIITDTNQGSLCDPLYSFYKKNKKKIIFIDHHIPLNLNKDNLENEICYIRTEASSTGEVVYDIIEKLNVKMTTEIAKSIYTSITFDTQAFKLLRNSSKSHEIASILANNNIETDQIQRELFATWTIEKMNFFSKLIQKTEYYKNNTVAGFHITIDDLKNHNLEMDQVNDLLDMFTLIKSVTFCFAIIEVAQSECKLSFRSINTDQAFQAAKKLGGGGHARSAGAWMNIPAAEAKKEILNFIHSF